MTNNIIETQNQITTIDAADLEHVTGGVAWGPLLTRAATWVGGFFSGGGDGGGGGTNVNVQNGSNNRSAQGNSGPVSLGDNSPISQGQ